MGFFAGLGLFFGVLIIISFIWKYLNLQWMTAAYIFFPFYLASFLALYFEYPKKARKILISVRTFFYTSIFLFLFSLTAVITRQMFFA